MWKGGTARVTVPPGTIDTGRYPFPGRVPRVTEIVVC